MLLTILIAFFSLIGLIIIHEFGHFILAKKFGVWVEEFGIGYPPRLFGKKIGETLYSFNLLPFGAFVKIHGEEEIKDSPRSFSQKPIWQRCLIVFGGVLSFWLIAFILLTFVMGFGAQVAIEDEVNYSIKEPKVQIVAVAANSPAELSGLRAGDTIKKISIDNSQFLVNKVKEVQAITEQYKGKEITLTIERGKEIFGVSLTPRTTPPKEEGPMGIALIRTAIKSYPWYEAPLRGISATGNLTLGVIQGWIQAGQNYFQGRPSGVQMMGPVGIFSLFTQVSRLGIVYFLQFIAIISVYLALFNILPIPMVDGGKLLFLGIEKIRKKPIPQKIEQNINSIFFTFLLALMIWVTIKDIARLF